jgi:hypothetical protein
VTQLTITTQPTDTVYGSVVSDVAVKTQDQFGNNSISGLGATENVVIAKATGAGTLSGTLTIDIGTGAGNGTATFSTLALDDLGAYTLEAQNATYTNETSDSFSITAKELTVTDSAVTSKTYDGNTTAVITGATLSGVEDGDVVTLGDHEAGTFDTALVGTSKVVTSAMTISGDDADLYTLTQPTLTGTITAKELTIGGTFAAENKVYDGGTVATRSDDLLTLTGVVGDDIVTLTPVFAFADEDVADTIVVSITGDSTIGGADVGNYTLSLTGADTDTANITAKELTVTGATVTTKVYDDTDTAVITGATLSGVVDGDTVILADHETGTFADQNVGVGKSVSTAPMTISGADVGNYTLTQPTLTGTITAEELTVTGITADDKAYNETTTAVVNTGEAALVGVIGGDDVTINVSSVTGTFDTAAIGSGKTVTIAGVSATGTDATNYSVTQPTTTAAITAGAINHFNLSISLTPTVGVPATLTITAVDAYDNTISAANGVTAFTGQVFLSTTNATGPFLHNNPVSFVSGDEGTNSSAAVTFNAAENDIAVNVYNSGATVTGTTGAVIDVTSTADVTAPTVVSQSPVADTTDVSIGVNPEILFSEAMDGGSIEDGLKLCLVSDTDCSSPIPATYLMSANGKKAIVISVDYLDYETAYWILATTDVTDEAGNALEVAYGSSTTTNFTTEEEVVEAEPTEIEVTGTSLVKRTATKNGQPADGWRWVIDVTLPDDVTEIQMSFSDFGGAGTITADNVRFYSVQSNAHSEGDLSIIIEEAGDWSTGMVINTDRDSSSLGTQIQIVVEAGVPEGSPDGFYSASYDIQDAPGI